MGRQSWRGRYWRVGYALADGMDVVHACGIKPQSITLSAAGRVALTGDKCWRISAASSSITVPGRRRPGAGAARLAQLAVHGEADRAGLLTPLPLEQAHRPDDRRVAHYAPQRKPSARFISS